MAELQGNWLLYLSGAEVPVLDCNIYIIPPTIKQIASTLGESDFLMGAHLLGNTDSFVNKLKEGNSLFDSWSNFQLLMVILLQDEKSNKIVKDFLQLICPKYDAINITESTIDFIIEDKNAGQINPYNFDKFAMIIKELFVHIKKDSKDNVQYNPVDEQAKKIAEKLYKGREKAAMLASLPYQNISIFGLYASVLSIGLGIDLNVLINYTPFQLYDSFSRYTKKLASDFYQKVSTTPLMDVSEMDRPDDWLEHFYG